MSCMKRLGARTWDRMKVEIWGEMEINLYESYNNSKVKNSHTRAHTNCSAALLRSEWCTCAI